MVESILKYVKGTPGKGICMGRYVSIDIVGYWDADWAGYIVQWKFTTNHCTFVGGNLVTWKGKKQKVVSRSGDEARAGQT